MRELWLTGWCQQNISGLAAEDWLAVGGFGQKVVLQTGSFLGMKTATLWVFSCFIQSKGLYKRDVHSGVLTTGDMADTKFVIV